MSTNRPSPPPECAQCGAAIPPSARACPACGADERTGWRESSIYDGLDLPDDADSENSNPARAPASSNLIGYTTRRVNGIAWYWWCIAVAVLLGFGLAMVGLR